MSAVLSCFVHSSVVFVHSDRHMHEWRHWAQLAWCTVKRGEDQRPRNGENKRRTVLTISDTFCYIHEAHLECGDDAHR
jgi:hypothetical protein